VEPTKIKTSRISFIWNYVIGLALISYLILSGVVAISPIITLFLIFLILLLFIEPEAIIIYHTFFVNPDSILEVKGIFTKKKTAIPYQNISSEKLIKGIMGRILNFGDIIISGYGSEIKMRGIRNPEKLYKLVEKKIAMYK
jgi:membrane protein YdbS with pleckstrin-like domain